MRLRVLASAILYRACLRAIAANDPGPKPSAQGPRPTAEEKMRLHARVEEAAWALPAETILEVDGRDVDDGPPDTPAWRDLVAALAAGRSA